MRPRRVGFFVSVALCPKTQPSVIPPSPPSPPRSKTTIEAVHGVMSSIIKHLIFDQQLLPPADGDADGAAAASAAAAAAPAPMSS